MNLTPEEMQVLASFRRIQTDWRRTFLFLTLKRFARADDETRTGPLRLVEPGHPRRDPSQGEKRLLKSRLRSF